MVREAKLFSLILFMGSGALLVIYLIPFFYTPDIDKILNNAYKVSFLPLTNFHPEPLEKLQLILFFISLPLFSIIFFKFLSNKLNSVFQQKTYISKIISITVSLLLPLTIFLSFNNYYDNYKIIAYFHLYFLYNLDYTYKLIFYVLYTAVLSSFFIPRVQKIIINSSDYIFILFSIFIFFFLYTETYPYQNSFHFNALFFSQYQVNTNNLILFTHGFKNTYGLYPHFLAWIFDFIPLTIMHFKTVFILLLNLSFLFLYLFLKKIIDNPFLVILTVISYMYYVSIYRVAVGKDLYFQYFPLRILFPFLTLYLISIYNTKKSTWKFILISITTALAILWNPDSGIMSLLLWIGYLSYINLNTKQIISSLKTILFQLACLLFLVFFILELYDLFVMLKYDTPFVWEDFFLAIRVFSSLGYYMIPLPSMHPYIVYLVFIIIALSFVFFFINNKKYIGLFLWTLWMIASFMYFQGRSHPYTFFSIIANIFIILPLLIYSFTKANMTKNIFIFEMRFIFIILTSFLVSSTILFIYNYLSDNHYRIILSPPAPSPSKLAYIKKHITKNETIQIIDPRSEGVLYAATQTFPAYHNSTVDMFMRADYEDLLNIIEKGLVEKIFISKKQLYRYEKSLKIKYNKAEGSNPYLLYYKRKSE